MNLDLPLVLHGSTRQLHVLRPAGEELALVALGGDEDHCGCGHVAVGAHLGMRELRITVEEIIAVNM